MLTVSGLKSVDEDLSEVGFVVGHFVLDAADGVDDVLTGGVMLGLERHGAVSVSKRRRNNKNNDLIQAIVKR